jgi:hypothetical protein
MTGFGFRGIVLAGALCAASAFAQAPKFKILIFDPATGDQGHASYLKDSKVFFPKLAQQFGFQADFSENWGDLNAAKLAGYKIVLFLDNRPDNASQRDAFKTWMDNGGAWIGCHFAAFALNNSAVPQNWDWYHNTFLGSGEYLSNTWRPTSAFLKVEDQTFPATKELPKLFKAQPNEWYRWKNDLKANKDIKILCSIDSSSYPLGTGPKQEEIWHSGYYPVVWTNTKYKMIYLNMGHNDIDYESGSNKELSHTFDNETQNKIITDFILDAGGITPVFLIAPAGRGARAYGLKALSAGWIGAGAFDPRGRAVPVAKSFGAYFLPETR